MPQNANLSLGDLFLSFFAFLLFCRVLLCCAVIFECVSVICRVCSPLSMLSVMSTEVRENGLIAVRTIGSEYWGSAKKSIEFVRKKLLG